MAAVVVGEGGLEKALRTLAKTAKAEAIYSRSADTRRYRSKAETRRLKRRHAAAKARAKG